MKVLVVSGEVWRSDTNGGNVLTNIFKNIDADFAQIYCNPGMPQNTICESYYQMTDAMVLSNILKQKPVGYRFSLKDVDRKVCDKESRKITGIISLLQKLNLGSLALFKDIIWLLSRWKNDGIKEFVEEFNPDIIFAPCYGSHFMLAMTRYIAELTSKPVISYISDDHHSFQVFSLSPLFWLNRILLRKNLFRTAFYYKLLYTMTDEQKQECELFMPCKVKIMRKSAWVEELSIAKEIHKPIRLIFAGNLYVGRVKTLLYIVRAIQTINKQGIRYELHVYSAYKPKRQEYKVLNDGINSYYHGLVSNEMLLQKYKCSDIALHIESFKLSNRLKTRLSFSTKITDCLSSGCAVMVVSWSGHAGFKYLMRYNAAICVHDRKMLIPTLDRIAKNPDEIQYYRTCAISLCRKNHDEKKILSMLNNDFNAEIEVSI